MNTAIKEPDVADQPHTDPNAEAEARAAAREQRPDLFEDPTPCTIGEGALAVRRNVSHVRGWNAARKRWQAAVRDAVAAGVTPPPYDIQHMGPIPQEYPDPRGGTIELHTLGLWRTWAHETGRVDDNGDRAERRGGGGGAGRDNALRADVIARRALLTKFLNAYEAARAAGAGKEEAVEIARQQCGVGNGTAWRMVKRLREEAAARGNPLD